MIIIIGSGGQTYRLDNQLVEPENSQGVRHGVRRHGRLPRAGKLSHSDQGVVRDRLQRGQNGRRVSRSELHARRARLQLQHVENESARSMSPLLLERRRLLL